MTDGEFNDLITKAMDELPQEYIKGLDNVAIVLADEPTSEQLRQAEVGDGRVLLGLYEGISLTKRGSNYNFVLPDKITLFKNSILSTTHNSAELFEQIKRTIWHEIAHYYGLNHDRISYLQNHKNSK